MPRRMLKNGTSVVCFIGGSSRTTTEADKHGVTLLKRVGQPKEVMIDPLTWLMESEGSGGKSGFFAALRR